MNPHEYNTLVYLAPIVASWVVTLGLGLLAYSRRRVTGALRFAVTMGLEATWIGGYILTLLSPTLEHKIFWENIQYFGTLLGPLMILVFAVEYCGHKFRNNWKLWAGLSLPALIVILLSFTNPWHNLALLNQRLIPGEPFAIYAYDFGFPVYAVLLYCYILLFWAIYLLWKHFSQQAGVYRQQTGFVLAGIVIPVVSSLTIFFDIPFLPQRDISPYYFAVADLFIAYGLFQTRLFDIVPFAHELVMANMEDGVIIVDRFGGLLDLNLAAKSMLEISENKFVGKPLANLLPNWLEPIELNQSILSVRKEIPLNRAGPIKTLDLRISRLLNKQGVFSGHMMIFRDITARKIQEDELRRGQDILEQRVSERTADLAAANQRLQAEVEQRRRAEQEKETQRSEMEILYRLTVELAALPVEADLEAIMTTRLKQLTGAFIVGISKYNPTKKQLEQRRVETDSGVIREADRLLDRSVTELTFPVSEAIYTEMVNTTVSYSHSLTEATFGAVPPAAGAMLQKNFNLNLIIGLAMQHQGELMGSLMLVLQNGQPVPSHWLMIALANVFSIIYRHKQAELERIESENRFHALAEMLPQSIFECNLSGQIIYANRKAFEVFGYDQLEPGLTITKLIEESQQAEAIRRMQSLIINRGESQREYLAQRKDGSIFPVMVYVTAIIQNDVPVGLRGVVTDITERKNVEAALRSSEEKFRSIIEQSAEGIMLVGEDGLVLELNQAFEKIYDMPKAEILGKPFWEMTRKLGYSKARTLHPMDAARKNYQDIIQNNPGTSIIREESEFITPDGHKRVIQRTAFPVMVSEGMRMAAVVSDITEQKIAEKEQRRLNRMLTMISECNQALIRRDDEIDLLQTICKIIVEIGDYRFAWIGSIQEPATQNIEPIAYYGEGLEYLKRLSEYGNNPEVDHLNQYILDGLKNLQPTIITDTRTDPIFEPYREESIQHGFLSVLSFPLIFGNDLFGSLNIYAGEPWKPDQNELGLLTEMVNDVSFGIHARRIQIDRDRAELQLHAANRELNQAYESTLEGWSHALELRERETAGHSQRVVWLTLEIAKRMGIPSEQLIHVRRGALLHDIGKMGIPDSILLKPDPLSQEDWAIMRRHPQMAYDLLSIIPYLTSALDIPFSHHERWDGSGYPWGLKGKEIPLAARIFAVVDVWDALTNDRPYRLAWTHEAALAYLQRLAGQQFDPQVVDEFLKLIAQKPELIS